MPTVPTATVADAITGRIVIRPAEVPAAELPESGPTLADLLAIELGDELLVQRRIDQAIQLSAYEHTHRELMRLRRQYRHLANEADDVVAGAATTFWRAA